MHQPIYVPYDDAMTSITHNGPVGGPGFSYSLHDMWASKGGPYKTWPIDAIERGTGLSHLGAQVDLSGSHIEGLNTLEAAGWNGCFYCGWKDRWNYGRSLLTVQGNPRLELVSFPYHHPILGLSWHEDIVLQFECHEKLFLDNFGTPYSSGLFPPEACFSTRAIPALVEAGIEWVMVDNIHLARTLEDYPWTGASGIHEPNLAEVRNGTLASKPNSAWVQLSGLWAPEKVAGGWGYRPHYSAHVDPTTGDSTIIKIVPAACYMGNEDARGGFGALNYEGVMSQLEFLSTDPDHPQLCLLHHDGENFGAGTESYYNGNFQSFVDWATANPSRFVPTTIQDYMELYPPDSSDVVHVEPGGWIGSGCLSPEFHYWLGDPSPYPTGYSPDWNSWAVITAAHNWVWTANEILPYDSIPSIVYDYGNATSRGFHDYLASQTSCYMYWEGGADEAIWNANPTRAANLAIGHVSGLVSGGTDSYGPTIFTPQRQPYNPGGTEWGASQPSDFEVWTFAYDLSGIDQIRVYYREDADGSVDHANMLYSGAWNYIDMTGETRSSMTSPAPLYKAQRYSAEIPGVTDAIVDYYIYARDAHGNETRTDICHVWVGEGGGGSGSSVTWEPESPSVDDTITITVDASVGGWLHWGVNGWNVPIPDYWPGETYVWGDSLAVETPLSGSGPYTATIGPFNDPSQPVGTIEFVIHFSDETWDNNSGYDYHISLSGGPATYTMDGELDAIAEGIATSGGYGLWAHFNGMQIYVATASAGVGEPTLKDHFIFVANPPGVLADHPWAKDGDVAQWDCYLGGENSTGWSGWFDCDGADPVSAMDADPAGVLEGAFDVAAKFGSIPDTLWLVACGYGTDDGAPLSWQVPFSCGSFPGDIEAIEYVKFPLTPPLSINELNLPEAISISAYPNPFNSAVTISVEQTFLSVQNAGQTGMSGLPMEIEIFDVNGRRISVISSEGFLPDEKSPADRGKISPSGRNVSQNEFVWQPSVNIGSGIYLVRATVEKQSITARVVYLK